MTAPINPQHFQAKISPEHLRVMQSFYKTLKGGVDMGVAVGKNAAGVYNSFEQGNSNGVLVRIGANSSSEQYKWSGGSTVTVTHGLGRQPIGFKIVDQDANATIWRTAVPTTTTLALQSSSNAVNVTVYIF